MAAEKKAASKGTSSTGSSTKKSSTSRSRGGSDAQKRSSGSSGARAPRAEPGRRMTGAKVAEAATRQLAELTSREIEGVTALQRTDEGWVVELEVLELRRIPSTTDVLATYEVTMDTSGELEEYRRGQRYVRGQAEGSA